MPTVLYAAFTAFVISYLILPPVLGIALKKRLYTQPGKRSSHTRPTPSLGGVGIFGGLFVSAMFWLPATAFAGLQYVFIALLVIFVTGLKDDLSPMSAQKKLLAQLLMAFLVTYFADIRLESLHGMFSWEASIPYGLSLVLSVFTVLVVTNAFNLIDGINGLATCLGIVVLVALGSWFLGAGAESYAVLAFAGIGALVGFLPFNIKRRARLFMGDTGSLVIGAIISILSLEFIEANATLPSGHPWHLDAIPVVAMTIISIPLFDTLRVFVTRIIRGVSPFQPDRRHIHHLLIDYGCSHKKATGILVTFKLALIGLVYVLQGRLEQHLLLLLLLSIVMLATYVLHRATMLKKANFNRVLMAEEIERPTPSLVEEEYSQLS